MLVVESKRALVISSNARDKILQAIPHAKTVRLNGRSVVAVPHKVDECLVLRNLGFREVPSPILSYYKWPGRYKPMAHQKTTAAFFVGHHNALCLSEPGTGKTAAAIWAADYLLSQKSIKRVLVVCPLSTMRSVWAKELKTFAPHRHFNFVLGTPSKKKQAMADTTALFSIINHDGAKVMSDYLTYYDLVIYDEGTALKNPSTDRFRTFNAFVTIHNPWLWVLTGTPFGQTPVDAWALARLVRSPTLGKMTYTAFKDRVMNKVSMFKWVPRADALDTCKTVLQPSIRYTLDECIELPQTVVVERQTELSPAQAKAFKEMQEKAVLTMHDITAVNAAVVMQKLIQIVCGVVYDGDSVRHKVDAAARLEDLKELIDEAGDKAIIYVPFRGVQDWLFVELKAHYGVDAVTSVHGDVSLTQRSKVFDSFQNGGSSGFRILLAHPRVASHGLTLTAARTVIWFAPIYSLEAYEQANARIRRIGTTGKTRVVHLYATAFERELYARLQHKKRVLANFLELVSGINYGD